MRLVVPVILIFFIVFNKNKITGSKDAADFFQPLLGDLNHEEFWVMLLNRGNKIQDTFMVSQGGVSGTVIDVRLILKKAIQQLASSIILCHNHPSGTMQASDADLKITKKISFHKNNFLNDNSRNVSVEFVPARLLFLGLSPKIPKNGV